MAIAVANSWTANGPLNTVDVAVSGFQVGDLIHVETYYFANSAIAFNDPTDDGGNDYTTQEATDWTSTFRCNIVNAWAIVVTPPTTITCSTAVTTGIQGFVARVTGATATPYDTASPNTETSATPTSAAFTTAQAAELVFASVTHDGGTTTLTEPTGFTVAQEVEDATNFPFQASYKVYAGVQTGATLGFTLGASRDAAMLVTAYKAAAAPTNDTPATVTGNVVVGQTLTADAATAAARWTGETSVTGKWQNSATSGGVYADIAAATASTYVVAVGDLTKYIRYLETATGVGGSTTQASNVVGPVTAAASSSAPSIDPATLMTMILAG